MKVLEMLLLGFAGLVVWAARSLTAGAGRAFAGAGFARAERRGSGKYYSYPVYGKKMGW